MSSSIQSHPAMICSIGCGHARAERQFDTGQYGIMRYQKREFSCAESGYYSDSSDPTIYERKLYVVLTSKGNLLAEQHTKRYGASTQIEAVVLTFTPQHPLCESLLSFEYFSHLPKPLVALFLEYVGNDSPLKLAYCAVKTLTSKEKSLQATAAANGFLLPALHL